MLIRAFLRTNLPAQRKSGLRQTVEGTNSPRSKTKSYVGLARILFFVLTIAVTCAFGQGGAKQNSNSSSGSGSAGPLTGINYPNGEWPTDLPTARRLSVLCYKLESVDSAAQPFILKPVAEIRRGDNTQIPCMTVDDKHPLVMDTMLVIAIDARKAGNMNRFRILNINITTQSGNPIVPTPIRPSIAAGATVTNLGAEHIYFLPWPSRLPGDTIPTVSITAIYTPPAPGEPWTPATLYPAGTIVIPTKFNGHYFMTLRGGMSGENEPTWTPAPMPSTVDNSCIWQYVGTSLPSGAQGQLWQPAHSYPAGSVVLSAANGNAYQTTSTCTSGNSLPTFASFSAAQANAITEILTSPEKTTDGTVQWQDLGTYDSDCSQNFQWAANTAYALQLGDNNTIICNPDENGRRYQVIVAGTSGNVKPTFQHKDQGSGVNAAEWRDLGQYSPSSVSAGGPTDQTLTLLNFQLPQSHTLSYYNLSTAVVVSTIKVKSFNFAASSGGANSGTAIQTGSSPLVDPVIFLSRYLVPFDAERKESWSDFSHTAIGLGFSLSSPTTNFYVGGSNELLRYIQLNYGFALAKISELPKQNVFTPSTNSTPTTVQEFKPGAYIGLSFNISGFIQGLASGGGGKSSSGQ